MPEIRSRDGVDVRPAGDDAISQGDSASDAAVLRRRLASLLVYRAVLDDAVGAAWLSTVDALAASRGQEALEAYARLFYLLANEAVSRSVPAIGDPWQNHLLDRVLVDDNPFSRRARSGRADDGAIVAAARQDLRVLQFAHSLDTCRLAGDVARAVVAEGGYPPDIVSFTRPRLPENERAHNTGAHRNLKSVLASAEDWGEAVELLARHYAAVGAGLFARYRAFRWVHEAGRGEIRGVADPDAITLDELVGYDSERELLLRNTEHLLAGYSANNVLVYGDRGTGKSSTIKALLNAGADRGLRLIEVPKQNLADFPEIIAGLRGRPERFILFVDDLSFGEQETEYKELKAVLEGGIEGRPENVVLYATSNRRHIVQERFADRLDPGDDVHGQDAFQEKLSLSDRFGITVTFLAPDQDRYLAIVGALAGRRALDLPADELRRRALQWAAWHNGRSGRCARQFVDYLAGELGTTARASRASP